MGTLVGPDQHVRGRAIHCCFPSLFLLFRFLPRDSFFLAIVLFLFRWDGFGAPFRPFLTPSLPSSPPLRLTLDAHGLPQLLQVLYVPLHVPRLDRGGGAKRRLLATKRRLRPLLVWYLRQLWQRGLWQGASPMEMTTLSPSLSSSARPL